MVLTQLPIGRAEFPPSVIVSIPLWFLRNGLKTSVDKAFSNSFPYHYGSYATIWPRKDSTSTWESFHTTMVLTQRYDQEKIQRAHEKVSIPLWFLRNTLSLDWTIRYPLGFHTTMVLTQLERNQQIPKSHMKFPYHYGSYATSQSLLSTFSKYSCFHTTMVLTQQPVPEKHLALCLRFHTTMVLTQQANKGAARQLRVRVSIPLWFLRNATCGASVGFFLRVSIPLWFLRNLASARKTWAVNV